MSCSDFVEVNRIVQLKCSVRRVLHGQRVWDAAQQVLARQEALYIQRHCLQRLWWYHSALLASDKPPARAHDFQRKSSALHLIEGDCVTHHR
nr:MAG TPA: hypothetical protein [Caudoviricetes sp.]